MKEDYNDATVMCLFCEIVGSAFMEDLMHIIDLDVCGLFFALPC